MNSAGKFGGICAHGTLGRILLNLLRFEMRIVSYAGQLAAHPRPHARATLNHLHW